MTRHLLVFGPGYTAGHIMRRARREGWQVSATFRDAGKAEALEKEGVAPIPFDDGAYESTQPVTDILCSISPPEAGDPALSVWKSWLTQQKHIQTVHYLSSTNVYGDHGGAWVDETSETKPSLERGKRRVVAEQAWLKLAKKLGAAGFVYRLAGIYGPGRNVFRSLKIGKSRRIIREGQVFGRIHVEDIENAVWLAANSRHKGGVFNLSDDMPTPPQQLVEAGAEMLGIAPPPEEAFESADLSPMARSFYLESKRVRNEKIKTELGFTFRYPTYREGLASLIELEK